MKVKFIFLASLLFAQIKSKKIFNFEKNKLSKFGISFKPLIIGSKNFIQDTAHNKTDRKRQLDATTTNIIRALQNPEVLCTVVTSIKKYLCDKSGKLVPLRIELATKELIGEDKYYYSGHQSYINSKENVIRIGTLDRINTLEQVFTFRHETIHELWVSFNKAICDGPKDSHPAQEHLDDTRNLTISEKLYAPYDIATKADFANAISKGENRLTDLRKMKIALLSTPAGNPLNRELKELIDCFEEEAQHFKIDENFARPGLTLFMQLIDKLEYEISLTKTKFLTLDQRLYEEDASIFGVLANYPKLFNYLFPEVHTWHENKIPEYRQCLDQIAPNRLDLTCKKENN